MKIGILTFHRAINYGAVLQCYGLYETLSYMGHNVEVIDYRPDYIEKYRRPIPFWDINHEKSITTKLRLFIANALSINSRLESSRRFDKFLYKNFKISQIINKPEDISQGYDAIIFGSDQIWSPQICFGFDPIYWGQFPHKNTRLLTYAASIGGHNHLRDDEWEKAGDYLKSFDIISVREPQLQRDLKDYLQIKSTLVVDPTILLNEDAYEKIVQRPKNIPQDYVLVFSVAPTNNLMGFAEKIASQTGCQIVVLTATKTPWIFSKRNENVITINPTVDEFLGLFKYAKSVVTVSFHGTVFSVIFRKDFYSLANYMQDRAEQFLQSIGLENRIFSSDDETIRHLQATSVDYSGISKKLSSIRVTSITFLLDCLGKR